MIRQLTYALGTIVALAFGCILASSNAYAAYKGWIELNSVTQTVPRAQHLMVCVNGSPSKSDTSADVVQTEMVALDLTGNIILVKELRAPDFGFQCVEIPYAELLGPRFGTDPMPDSVTVRIDVRRSIGADQAVSIGSPRTTAEIMTIGYDGKAEQHLHLRLYAVKVTSYSVNGSGLD
jgi:hypothetical protein